MMHRLELGLSFAHAGQVSPRVNIGNQVSANTQKSFYHAPYLSPGMGMGRMACQILNTAASSGRMNSKCCSLGTSNRNISRKFVNRSTNCY